MAGKIKQSFKRIKRTFRDLFDDPRPDQGTGSLPVPTNAPNYIQSANINAEQETTPTTTASRPAPPFNSPDILTTRVMPLTQPTEPETAPQPEIALPANEGANSSGWAGLRLFAGVVGKGASVFGPFKQTADVLVSFIDIFETMAKDRKDYEEIKAQLDALFGDICEYLKARKHAIMSSSMRNLELGVKRETELIEHMQQRNGTSRYLSSEQDIEDVANCYRRIEGLLRRFTLNANAEMWKTVDEIATENRLDRLPNSPAAYYSSAASTSLRRGGCTENTRVGLLEQMHDWACDGSGPMIYWLNGMAGTGKTTVLYSLCDRLEQEKTLAASFFCSRQLPECRNVNQIIPSLSYQLSRFSPPFRHALSSVLESNADAHNRKILQQFEHLISIPMKQLENTLPNNLVIVIDALDECDADTGVSDILSVLLSLAPSLHVKFLVASRPDPDILDRMRSKEGKKVNTEIRLHELDQPTVRNDIRTYLRSELEPHLTIPEVDINTLVRRSDVLFIYAATVVRYIGADSFSKKNKRLAEVLEVSTRSSNQSTKEIDALYTAILRAAFSNPALSQSEKDEMRLIIHTVVCAQEPLPIGVMAGLLRLDAQETVHPALRPLFSVLQISGHKHIITTLHESFPNYLLDKDRSDAAFYCNKTIHHARLAQLCFDQISIPRQSFNICDLKSSYVLDRDVPDLDARVNSTISGELLYGCRHWDAHLKTANYCQELAGTLWGFLSGRLLLWMELMNLTGNFAEGTRIMYETKEWPQNTGLLDNSIHSLLEDAWMFMSTYASGDTHLSTPHLYVSTLSFWPANNPISKLYPRGKTCIIDHPSTAMKMRREVPLTRIGAQGLVNCVCYSPSGLYIVSGSRDNILRIWDVRSGQQVGQPLQGHTNSVTSVAYSPDGAYIVSGSHDETVRIWDAHTGQQVGQPLQGHTSSVYSVAYSPDSAYIVSGSYDETVRIWDAHTGQQVGQPLQGHTDSVSSVAYSPDGAYIVSGSGDKTVRIWDAHTGQQVGQPLQGHTNSVNSVAYSPDGAYIVSGSHDETVRIWDAHTGQQVGQPLQGHTDLVKSVAYSPDGTYIVSGCYDKTVRIWDAHTGHQVGQPLQGHTDSVFSVAYSPDGTYIVSGCYDKTVRIWDAHTGHQVGQPLQGHTDSVFSVAYSPDGAYIVSGSHDKTVRIWDPHTGQQVGQPLQGHTDLVKSVAYSPDGAYIVSGSDDETVRIWDAHTGQQVGQPLQGHTDSVSSVAYSPDGAYIVSGSGDKTVRIWDAHTGQQVGQPLQGHASSVNSVAYSPNSAYIVSGSGDKTVRIWDAHTGQQVGQPLQGHTDSVFSVAYSPDCAYIVSGSHDETVRIWDARTGQQVGQPLQGHTDSVFSVAYSPDGAYIVSGSHNETVRIWDAHTGQQVGQPLQGHTSPVNSVAYSPDGAYIVSGSHDSTVRIWNSNPFQAISKPSAILDHSASSFHSSSSTPSSDLHIRNIAPHICSSACQATGQHQTWTLNDDGWAVLESGELLVWIPEDLRTTLLSPQNAAIASSPHGVLCLEFDGIVGEHWAEHLTPRQLSEPHLE